jgi:hypothetical protein
MLIKGLFHIRFWLFSCKNAEHHEGFRKNLTGARAIGNPSALEGCRIIQATAPKPHARPMMRDTTQSQDSAGEGQKGPHAACLHDA